MHLHITNRLIISTKADWTHAASATIIPATLCGRHKIFMSMIPPIFYTDEVGVRRFFFEHGEFFHEVSVNLEFPFTVGGSIGWNSIYWAGDVPNIPGCGDTLESWVTGMHSVTTSSNLSRSQIKPGVFHPRIWRGEMPNLSTNMLADSTTAYSKAVEAGRLSAKRLFKIFEYIEPTASNLQVFGHNTHKLLLSSCTEVESGWSGVLSSNSYSGNGRLSTNDYVKLLEPMQLARYEVQFPLFSEVPPQRPFASWRSSQPTKSLTWYDAYNATKHNREQNFGRASLQNAVEAVSAVAVMLCAQFGPAAVPSGIQVTLNGVDPDFLYCPLRHPDRKPNEDGKTTQYPFDYESSIWTKEPCSI